MHIHIDEKKFGKTRVLRNITLDIEPAKGVAIRGPSGIGKSTLLRIIAGLDHHFSGQIQNRPARIGMVFQEPFLMNWRTALENITLFTGASTQEANAALSQVELPALGARLPQELSIGQQRRVSLARALASNPQLLILDEAFASLDQETAALMRKIVQDYVQNNQSLLILATHQDEDLELASEIFTMQDGQLTKSQSKPDN